MKLHPFAFAAFPLFAAVFGYADVASACGGCFHEPPLPTGESSQVTGHRMVQVISTTESTLYDQISYSGNPASFAWVLPVKGLVKVGLSSDVIFAALSDDTKINVLPPPINCPPPPSCWDPSSTGFSASFAGAGGNGGGGGVTVVAQEVVGPYDTVQLSSTDPAALNNWLVMNGYVIPPDIAPVISAYVNEGFDFFAMKLVPGAGLDSMRPVRITTPGANPKLPLRMVAAGTGMITPITLWVIGEGRYEPTNFNSFVLNPADVIWNWDTQSSNYAMLKDSTFQANKDAWLVEYAAPMSTANFTSEIETVCSFYPSQSGYGDAMGNMVQQECDEDLQQLFSGVDPTSAWLTRLRGELSRQAFAKDLTLGADMDQSNVSNVIQTTQSTGKAPECPVYPPCNTSGTGGSGGGSGGEEDTGCGVSNRSESEPPMPMAMLIALGAMLGLARRRKARDSGRSES